MSERARRFFWGNSLAQAVMSAARYHRIEPETLAYQIHEKRHGFVKQPRAVVIEVDPAGPRRAAGGAAPAAERAPVPTAERRSPPRPAPPAQASPRAEEARGRSERRAPAAHGGGETWDAPDGESEVAAIEAGKRLLHFAGLEVELEVRAAEDRLEIRLTGADEARVAAKGIGWLEELEHLLPRAIHGLSGRMVRCRLECGGLRESHDRQLQELAAREADRAVANGEPVLLEPLSSAERRVVHLALLDRPDVTTESVGSGARKRIRISPA